MTDEIKTEKKYDKVATKEGVLSAIGDSRRFLDALPATYTISAEYSSGSVAVQFEIDQGGLPSFHYLKRYVEEIYFEERHPERTKNRVVLRKLNKFKEGAHVNKLLSDFDPSYSLEVVLNQISHPRYLKREEVLGAMVHQEEANKSKVARKIEAIRQKGLFVRLFNSESLKDLEDELAFFDRNKKEKEVELGQYHRNGRQIIPNDYLGLAWLIIATKNKVPKFFGSDFEIEEALRHPFHLHVRLPKYNYDELRQLADAIGAKSAPRFKISSGSRE